jgi:hypothetical protein
MPWWILPILLESDRRTGMRSKRRNCANGHRFQEHGIGAGLTRKVCVVCGDLGIGERRRSVSIDQDLLIDKRVLASAG